MVGLVQKNYEKIGSIVSTNMKLLKTKYIFFFLRNHPENGPEYLGVDRTKAEQYSGKFS